MPQPYRKKILTLAGIDMGPMAVLKRHEPALGIAAVAAAWGNVERSMEFLTLVMLGVDAKIGHAIYSALIGSAAQKAAFNAIAKLKLTGDEQTHLAELLAEFAARGGERNRVVHGVWAALPDVPDGLVLLDMDAHLPTLVAFEAGERTSDDAQEMKGKHLVYKARDFQDVLDRMLTLQNRLFIFGVLIRNRGIIKRAKNNEGDGGSVDGT
ncbi:MAG TPA: hypothetical protein VEA80_16935 [Vitreimonas sp.]|nr:hypothetical protein [Vitreimonas sp.]